MEGFEKTNIITPAGGRLYINKDLDQCLVKYSKYSKLYLNRRKDIYTDPDEYFPVLFKESIIVDDSDELL